MVVLTVIGVIVLLIALVIYFEYRNEKKYKEERRRHKEKRDRALSPKVTKRTPPKPAAKPQNQTPAEVKQKTEPANAPSTSPIKKEEKAAEKSPQEAVKKREPVKENKPATPPKAKTETDTLKKAAPLKTKETKETKETLEKQKTSIEKPVEKKEVPVQEKETAKKPADSAESTVVLPKGEYPEFNYTRLLEMGLSEEEAQEFIQELIPQIEEQIPLLQEAMNTSDFHQMERLTHSIKGSSTTIGTGGISDLLTEYNTYLKDGKEIAVLEAYQKHLKHYCEVLKKQFPKG